MHNKTYAYCVTVNPKPTGWRTKAAQMMADLASKLDGLHRISIRTDTTPAISSAEKVECIEYATKIFTDFLGEQLKFAAMAKLTDDVLKQHPTIFLKEEN